MFPKNYVTIDFVTISGVIITRFYFIMILNFLLVTAAAEEWGGVHHAPCGSYAHLGRAENGP